MTLVKLGINKIRKCMALKILILLWDLLPKMSRRLMMLGGS